MYPSTHRGRAEGSNFTACSYAQIQPPFGFGFGSVRGLENGGKGSRTSGPIPISPPPPTSPHAVTEPKTHGTGVQGRWMMDGWMDGSSADKGLSEGVVAEEKVRSPTHPPQWHGGRRLTAPPRLKAVVEYELTLHVNADSEGDTMTEGFRSHRGTKHRRQGQGKDKDKDKRYQDEQRHCSEWVDNSGDETLMWDLWARTPKSDKKNKYETRLDRLGLNVLLTNSRAYAIVICIEDSGSMRAVAEPRRVENIDFGVMEDDYTPMPVIHRSPGFLRYRRSTYFTLIQLEFSEDRALGILKTRHRILFALD
ncbi:hypothetical protein K439DRAFT_1561760 [Ramaria rubella]|nr:hypothetical protein K439DRAFT_1561760 [Ramaria rubella]